MSFVGGPAPTLCGWFTGQAARSSRRSQATLPRAAGRRTLFSTFALLLVWGGQPAHAVRVNPTGVNVRSQGATSAFLTFGELREQTPAEGIWCGAVVPAEPDVGLKCDPATIFGQLPARFDQSRLHGTTSFTDVMTIPPSVARRAYQDAQRGQPSAFLYVRRFQSRAGGPDEFVPVTCRLTAGGARVPLAITDVKITFLEDHPVPSIRQGQPAPSVRAILHYNGTGRLKGRWEIVRPGEEGPTENDLRTEGSLPIDERATQRRFSELERFNVFLPPTGRYELRGPSPQRIPTDAEGTYQLLLRIEASDDKEADTNLEQVGAGNGIVHTGAVAGFPIPALRYYVVGAAARGAGDPAAGGVRLLAPSAGARFGRGESVELRWSAAPDVRAQRVDVKSADGDQAPIHALALVGAGATSYRTAPGLEAFVGSDGALWWRVVGLGAQRTPITESEWRKLEVDGAVAPPQASEPGPAAVPASP
jgi:hypothetical protein